MLILAQMGVTPCPPAGTGTEGLTSFAPSLARLALTNPRVEALADGPGTFRLPKRHGAGWKRLTRPAEAFLHRFRQPGLPRGFCTVRASGLLRPRRRHRLPQRRTRLAAPLPTAPAPEGASPRAPAPPPPRPAADRGCRPCGGRLGVLGRLAPPPREPPEAPHRMPRPPG